MYKFTPCKYGLCIIILTAFMGCRKDLCCDHLNEVDLHLEVIYSLDWCLPWSENWNENWPEEWVVDWDKMRPKEPESIRLHIFDCDHREPVSNYNLDCHGGNIQINSGRYDMLLYNNDTEGIIFENINTANDASATTRSHSRTTYSSRYPEEILTLPPGVLFAVFMPECELEFQKERDTQYLRIDAKLTPRTWTYHIRYEFISGKEYVAEAQAYLSGMAGEVCLKDGCTNDNKVVTLLMDCVSCEYGVWTITRSFGLPGFKYDMVNNGILEDHQSLSEVTTSNKLVLEMKLLSGRTKILEFDVTDQVRKQPRGGVIVVKEILVTPEEGQKPNTGSGFDGDVNDWDENIDLDIPIT